MKIDHNQRKVFVHFTFEKEIEERTYENVISVDVNESNVTVKVLNNVYVLQTDVKKLTLGYANYREVIQSVKGNRYVKRVIHGRERNKKRDRRYKIASIVASTAEKLKAVVVLEKLPKQCPKNMIRDVRDKRLRHRIYQAGFRSVIKAIEEKCIERGIPVIKVNPKNTSSICPFCGSKLMRGDAPRQVTCPRCGIRMGRDVVAVLNLALKGSVPLSPMSCDSIPEVAVLPMKEWMRRNSYRRYNLQ